MLNQQASIGKPPERQKPPSTFQGGMRRIVYVEQEPQEEPEQKPIPKGLTRGKALAYLARYGYLSDLPKDATITKLEPSEQGYNIEYVTPTQEAMFSYKGEEVSGKDLARIAKQAPPGYEIGSIKREGDSFNIVYQEKPKPQEPISTYEYLTTMGVVGAAPVLTAPSIAEVNKQMQEDMSGRAYAWTTADVWNIASTGLLVATAAHSILNLPKRLALAGYESRITSLREELYKPTPLEEAGIQQSASPEFQLQTVQPTETRQFQPPEQWYKVTRGTPTTPMTTTLEKTLYPGMGGISAEQTLVPRSSWEAPYDLLQIRMIPKSYPLEASMPLPLFMLKTAQPTRLTPTTKAATLAGVKSAFGISQAQLSIQKQALATQQVQALRQMQLQRQMQITRQREVSLDFGLPKAMGKRGKEMFGLWGRYKRLYPIATAKEVMRMRKRKFL